MSDRSSIGPKEGQAARTDVRLVALPRPGRRQEQPAGKRAPKMCSRWPWRLASGQSVRVAKARLLVAVEAGMVEPLGVFGFGVAGSDETHRGARVELTNGEVLISVDCDWLEGELTVSVRRGGGAEMPVEQLVDLTKAKALRLSRLGRSVSADALTSQLRKVSALLVEQVPDVLAST